MSLQVGAVKSKKAAKVEKELANNEFGSPVTNFCIDNSMTKIMQKLVLEPLLVSQL
jgi:hypothetical protein